jgi:hypothetical protein
VRAPRPRDASASQRRGARSACVRLPHAPKPATRALIALLPLALGATPQGTQLEPVRAELAKRCRNDNGSGGYGRLFQPRQHGAFEPHSLWSGARPTVPSLRQRPTKMTVEQVSELIAMHEQGAPIDELADTFGIHRTTVMMSSVTSRKPAVCRSRVRHSPAWLRTTTSTLRPPAEHSRTRGFLYVLVVAGTTNTSTQPWRRLPRDPEPAFWGTQRAWSWDARSGDALG